MILTVRLGDISYRSNIILEVKGVKIIDQNDRIFREIYSPNPLKTGIEAICGI